MPVVPEVVYADGLPEPTFGSVMFGSYRYTSKLGRSVDWEPSDDRGAAARVGVVSRITAAVERVVAHARLGLDSFTPVGRDGLDTKVTERVGLVSDGEANCFQAIASLSSAARRPRVVVEEDCPAV